MISWVKLLGALLGGTVLPFSMAQAASFSDYAGCVKLASAEPSKALSEAEAWKNQGGGFSAEHCAILALNGLKRYPEAAARLDKLAKADGMDFRQRARLYEQAGNAWIAAGRMKSAEQDFDAGLQLLPDDLELHTGRARARAMRHHWQGVASDLTAALRVDQNRADLLVERAKAYRAMHKKELAATDILRALTLFPDYPPALLQRGIMKMQAGDQSGARRDFEMVAGGHGLESSLAKRYLSMFGSF